MVMLTPKEFIAGSAIAATATTYYTVPTSTTAILKELTLCNTDTSTRTVDIWIIPSGGSGAVANQIFQDLALVAGETKIFSLSRVISTGGFIQAAASSASVVHIDASGIEVT
jgi:hypothetical protein